MEPDSLLPNSLRSNSPYPVNRSPPPPLLPSLVPPANHSPSLRIASLRRFNHYRPSSLTDIFVSPSSDSARFPLLLPLYVTPTYSSQTRYHLPFRLSSPLSVPCLLFRPFPPLLSTSSCSLLIRLLENRHSTPTGGGSEPTESGGSR